MRERDELSDPARLVRPGPAPSTAVLQRSELSRSMKPRALLVVVTTRERSSKIHGVILNVCIFRDLVHEILTTYEPIF